MSSGEDRNIIGGATIFLFNRKKQLKTGRQKLRLWPKKEADGRIPTTTPGKVTHMESFICFSCTLESSSVAFH